MISHVTTLTYIFNIMWCSAYLLVREERPTMVLCFLQKEMSFLKARKSNSICTKYAVVNKTHHGCPCLGRKAFLHKQGQPRFIFNFTESWDNIRAHLLGRKKEKRERKNLDYELSLLPSKVIEGEQRIRWSSLPTAHFQSCRYYTYLPVMWQSHYQHTRWPYHKSCDFHTYLQVMWQSHYLQLLDIQT